MAGRGPAPKRADQRRRREAPKAGDWVRLPSEPYEGPRPRMPELETLEAIATWELWWGSPMAHMWSEGDWPGLLRLIMLIDGSASLEALKETRLQEERFGLSPKGRQTLRWVLPDGESALADVRPLKAVPGDRMLAVDPDVS